MAEYFLLILGIFGASLGLIGVISKTFATQNKAKIALVIAVLGFVILTIQQLFEFNQKQNKRLLDQHRTETIKEIKNTVFNTSLTVDSIAKKLESISIGSLGQELTLVESDANASRAVKAMAHGKGGPALWPKYADWLVDVTENPEAVPCLSITLNANKHYNAGLLMMYLLTHKDTNSDISKVIDKKSRWKYFPDDRFIDRYGINPRSIKCVLFYLGRSESRYLMAYADARSFVKELLAYIRTRQSSKVEAFLNDSFIQSFKQLREYFPSARPILAIHGKPGQAARLMIEKRIPEAAVFQENKMFLVKLETIIKLVTKQSG